MGSISVTLLSLVKQLSPLTEPPSGLKAVTASFPISRSLTEEVRAPLRSISNPMRPRVVDFPIL